MAKTNFINQEYARRLLGLLALRDRVDARVERRERRGVDLSEICCEQKRVLWLANLGGALFMDYRSHTHDNCRGGERR